MQLLIPPARGKKHQKTSLPEPVVFKQPDGYSLQRPVSRSRFSGCNVTRLKITACNAKKQLSFRCRRDVCHNASGLSALGRVRASGVLRFVMLTLSLDTSEGRNLQKSRQSWFSHSSPRWLELWRVASASMCRDHGCIVDPSTIIYSCLGMRCPVDFVADAVYLPEVIYIIC